MDIDRNHTIDKYFRENLFSAEIPVPDGIFQKVEERLSEKKRRKFLAYVYTTAASIAVFLALGTGYFLGIRNFENVLPDNEPVSVKIEPHTLPLSKIVHHNDKTIELSRSYPIPISKPSEREQIEKKQTIEENLTADKNNELIIDNTKEALSHNHFSFRNLKPFWIKTKQLIAKSPLKQDNAEFAQKTINRSIDGEQLAMVHEKAWRVTPDMHIPHFENTMVQVTERIAIKTRTKSPTLAKDLYGGKASNNYVVNAPPSYSLTADMASIGNVSSGSTTNSTKSTVSYMTRTVTKNLPEVRFVELPVIGSYHFSMKKLKLGIAGGFTANLPVVSSKISQTDNSSSLNKTLYYNGVMGASVEIPLLNKLNFHIEPLFSYPINNGGQQGSFRIFTGLQYSF
jgi:hypothetical protein